MNKNIIIIFFTILTISAFSQDDNKKLVKINEKLDSLYYSEINQITRIDELVKVMKIKSDSLKRELLFYKVKEDYYSTALSNQANRFTLIISGILALFAVISFGAFKFEIFRIRKETDKKLQKHKKEIKQYKKQLSETNTELKGAKGNIYTSIAKYFEKENDCASAFFYYIIAAKGHGESTKEKNKSVKYKESIEKEYNVCLGNLKLALTCLDKIITDDDKKRLNIKADLDLTKKAMDEIYNLNDDEVKYKIAEIRVKYLKLINTI